LTSRNSPAQAEAERQQTVHARPDTGITLAEERGAWHRYARLISAPQAGEVAQRLLPFEPVVILSEAKDLMAIASGVLVCMA